MTAASNKKDKGAKTIIIEILHTAAGFLKTRGEKAGKCVWRV